MDTLDHVLQVLSPLASQKRAVGIISHVPSDVMRLPQWGGCRSGGGSAVEAGSGSAARCEADATFASIIWTQSLAHPNGWNVQFEE